MKKVPLITIAATAGMIGMATTTQTHDVQAATGEKAAAPSTTTTVETATQQVKTAQATADKTVAAQKLAQQALTDAKTAVDQATKAQADAQANKAQATPAGISAAKATITQAQSDVAAAQGAVQKAQADLATAKADVDAKQAEVDTAKQALSAQQAIIDQHGSLAATQAKVDDATKAQSQAQQTADASTANVTQAQATVNAAQTSVETTQQQIAALKADAGSQQVNVTLTAKYWAVVDAHQNDPNTPESRHAFQADIAPVAAAMGLSYTPSASDQQNTIEDPATLTAEQVTALSVFTAGVANAINSQITARSGFGNRVWDVTVTPNALKAATIAVQTNGDNDFNIAKEDWRTTPASGKTSYAAVGLPDDFAIIGYGDTTGFSEEVYTNTNAPDDKLLAVGQLDATKAHTMAYWKQLIFDAITTNLSTLTSGDLYISGNGEANESSVIAVNIDQYGNLHLISKDSSLADAGSEAFFADPIAIPALNSGYSAATQAKLNTLEPQLEAQQKTLATAQASLTAAKTQATTDQDALTRANSALSAAQAQLKILVDAVSHTAQSDGSALQAAQAQLPKLTQALAAAQAALAEAQKAQTQATATTKAKHAALEAANQNLAAAVAKLAALQNADANLANTKQALADAQSALAQAQAAADATYAPALAAQRALQTAEAQLAKLNQAAAWQAQLSATQAKHNASGHLTPGATSTHAATAKADTANALPHAGETRPAGILAMAGVALLSLLGFGVFNKRRQS